MIQHLGFPFIIFPLLIGIFYIAVFIVFVFVVIAIFQTRNYSRQTVERLDEIIKHLKQEK